MIYYLHVGMVLGCIVTYFQNYRAPRGRQLRTISEILLFTVLGALLFCLALPVSVLPALTIGVTFGIINQIPKWFWGSSVGRDIGAFCGAIPLLFFVPILINGFAWYGAVLAAIAWFGPLEVSQATIDLVAFNAMLLFASYSWFSVAYTHTTHTH